MLEDGETRVAILSLGCITQSWEVGGQGVVLGHADPAAYIGNRGFKGGIVGRVAGRIAGARFDLDGQSWALDRNEPPNHLHGGSGGLITRNWTLEPDGARAVRLTYHSPHGDQGYPGAVDFAVLIRLSGHTLTYDMRAVPDRPTPISLAQHSYYNLMGQGAVWDHVLSLPASRYLPVGEGLLATGEKAPLDAVPFDFRAPRSIAQADPARAGLDLAYAGLSGPVHMAAPNGMCLRMESDQPCLQLYTGQNLGPPHVPFEGLCLEPQQYPDALNHPVFPSNLATPDAPYRQRLSVTIERGP